MGLDAEDIMLVELMMIAMRIQHLEVNIKFDLSTKIMLDIHHGVMKVRENCKEVGFRHYSLLCHLILYQNRFYWDKRLKLQMLDEQGKRLPVQC